MPNSTNNSNTNGLPPPQAPVKLRQPIPIRACNVFPSLPAGGGKHVFNSIQANSCGGAAPNNSLNSSLYNNYMFGAASGKKLKAPQVQNQKSIDQQTTTLNSESHKEQRKRKRRGFALQERGQSMECVVGRSYH